MRCIRDRTARRSRATLAVAWVSRLVLFRDNNIELQLFFSWRHIDIFGQTSLPNTMFHCLCFIVSFNMCFILSCTSSVDVCPAIISVTHLCFSLFSKLLFIYLFIYLLWILSCWIKHMRDGWTIKAEENPFSIYFFPLKFLKN